FGVIFLALGEVGIACLELQVDAVAAGLTLVVLELDLAVDAPVGVGRRPEDLPGLARDGEGVADLDQLLALAVESLPDPFLQLAPPRPGFGGGELLLDPVPERNARLALDADDVLESLAEPGFNGLAAYDRVRAVGANVVARPDDVQGPGHQVLVDVAEEDDF